jgi:hypothetical protein
MRDKDTKKSQKEKKKNGAVISKFAFVNHTADQDEGQTKPGQSF